MSSVTQRWVVGPGGLLVPAYTIGDGIGDKIARALHRFGFSQKPGCGCPQRQASLNRLFGGQRRAPAVVGRYREIAGGAGGNSACDAGGGCFHCATTESSLNSASTTITCDDFELTGAGGTPGVWYTTHCGDGVGEQNPLNKGWCGNDFSTVVDGMASAGGANGTSYTARSVCGASSGCDGRGYRNFGSTCRSGGLNCSVSGGVAQYEEVYFRFYIRLNVGWTNATSGNQKVITFSEAAQSGISLAGPGYAFGHTEFVMCPFLDCNILSFRNPQAIDPFSVGQGVFCNASGCVYLGQNLGNGIANPGAAGSQGHWFAFEFRIRLNTPDVQDGLWDIWADDCGVAGTGCTGTPTHRASYTNVRYRGAAGGNSALKIGSAYLDTWTNFAGDGSTGTISIDQLVVATQRIGWMGASPIVPPSAPVNLRFGL